MSDFIESKVVEVDALKMNRFGGYDCDCKFCLLKVYYHYCPSCGSKIKWINKNEER